MPSHKCLGINTYLKRSRSLLLPPIFVRNFAIMHNTAWARNSIKCLIQPESVKFNLFINFLIIAIKIIHHLLLGWYFLAPLAFSGSIMHEQLVLKLQRAPTRSLSNMYICKVIYKFATELMITCQHCLDIL